MPNEEKQQTKWGSIQNKLLEEAKFLARGTKVIIDASILPIDCEVEGRYGSRKMYMIRTVNFGMVYVSPIQLINICRKLEQAKYENVTVEL
jgi:hypothetical protein